jgi:hypothetical protein
MRLVANETSRQNPKPANPPRKMLSRRSQRPKNPRASAFLKETLQAFLVQKKPAPDKVENVAKEYFAELKEVDVTFEKGTAVLEKYRAKYPELASQRSSNLFARQRTPRVGIGRLVTGAGSRVRASIRRWCESSRIERGSLPLQPVGRRTVTCLF